MSITIYNILYVIGYYFLDLYEEYTNLNKF